MDDYSKKMFISFGVFLGVILFIVLIIIPWGI